MNHPRHFNIQFKLVHAILQSTYLFQPHNILHTSTPSLFPHSRYLYKLGRHCLDPICTQPLHDCDASGITFCHTGPKEFNFSGRTTAYLSRFIGIYVRLTAYTHTHTHIHSLFHLNSSCEPIHICIM